MTTENVLCPDRKFPVFAPEYYREKQMFSDLHFLQGDGSIYLLYLKLMHIPAMCIN